MPGGALDALHKRARGVWWGVLQSCQGYGFGWRNVLLSASI